MGWRWRGLVEWIARRWNGGEMVRESSSRWLHEARKGMIEVRRVLVKCMMLITNSASKPCE